MRKIAMLQPNYIPWKGVFDLISRVDVFVFYDDVQYTTKDWRNRNKIKTKDGEKWLSVPVKQCRTQLICDALIDTTQDWQVQHFKTIHGNYRKAKYLKDYEHILEQIFLGQTWEKISDLDIFATKLIAKELKLDVEWVRSSDLALEGDKDGEKIIRICKHLDCQYFINGPSARSFMDESKFRESGVVLDYMTYDYEEYSQLYPPFSHYVSILDVLFNCGPDARRLTCMGSN